MGSGGFDTNLDSTANGGRSSNVSGTDSHSDEEMERDEYSNTFGSNANSNKGGNRSIGDKDGNTFVGIANGKGDIFLHVNVSDIHANWYKSGNVDFEFNANGAFRVAFT